MTTIYNLSNNTEIYFNCEPEEALVSAYVIYSNLSALLSNEDVGEKLKGKIVRGRRSMRLGNFVCAC